MWANWQASPASAGLLWVAGAAEEYYIAQTARRCRIHPEFPYIDAEVRYAVREYAATAVDVIARSVFCPSKVESTVKVPGLKPIWFADRQFISDVTFGFTQPLHCSEFCNRSDKCH